MDIEHFECRALLGSPGLFHDPRVYIPYFIMEWTYTKATVPAAGGKSRVRLYEEECPLDMIKYVNK